MSVLIKGMEMPTSCVVCPLGLNGFPDEQIVICTRLGRFVSNPGKKPEGIPKDCPLVEIPTPHGRLIDADAVLSQYNGFIQTAQCDYAEGLRDAAEDIKTAPTIDVTEER